MLQGTRLRPIISSIPLPILRWLAMAGAVLALAVVASVWRVGLDRKSHDLVAAIASMRQQLNVAIAEGPGPTPEPDFAQGLPEASSIEPIVRELQRSSAAEGTAFVSLSSTPRAATQQTLGRTELSVTLRGAYPRLKTVLAQALDRFPQLVVQRLTLRRMATSADLEAHVDLMLLARPLAAPSAGS